MAASGLKKLALSTMCESPKSGLLTIFLFDETGSAHLNGTCDITDAVLSLKLKRNGTEMAVAYPERFK